MSSPDAISENLGNDISETVDLTHADRPSPENRPAPTLPLRNRSPEVSQTVTEGDQRDVGHDPAHTEINTDINADHPTWVEGAENEEARVSKKAAHKSKVATKREKQREERGQAKSRAREEGKPPPTPCPRCKGDHWAQDCRIQAEERTINCPSTPRTGTFTPQTNRTSKRDRSNSLMTPTPSHPRKISRGRGRGRTKDIVDPRQNQESGDRDPTGEETPQAKTEKPKILLTRRAEKGQEGTEHAFMADGTWLYVKLPQEIRTPGSITLSDLVEAILQTQVLTPNDITSATAHDQKGWVVRCTTPEIAKKATGLGITLQGFKAKMTPYRTGGASIFVTDLSGHGSPQELARGIAENTTVKEKKLAFWLGIQEYRGIRGGGAVIAFTTPPGVYAMELPVGPPSHKNASAFRVKFRAVSLISTKCEVCKVEPMDHHILKCPQLQGVRTQENLGPCTLLMDPPNLEL